MVYMKMVNSTPLEKKNYVILSLLSSKHFMNIYVMPITAKFRTRELATNHNVVACRLSFLMLNWLSPCNTITIAEILPVFMVFWVPQLHLY